MQSGRKRHGGSYTPPMRRRDWGWLQSSSGNGSGSLKGRYTHCELRWGRPMLGLRGRGWLHPVEDHPSGGMKESKLAS